MCTCMETSQLGLLACISLGTRGGEGEMGTLVEKEEGWKGMRGEVDEVQGKGKEVYVEGEEEEKGEVYGGKRMKGRAQR